MVTLSRLVTRTHCENKRPSTPKDLEHLRNDLRYIAALNEPDLADFLALANTHHVIVRALTAVENAAVLDNDDRIAGWCQCYLNREHARIETAVGFLASICECLESQGCNVAVIKSLDHWPDLGSDLDLYTTADEKHVSHVLGKAFGAQPVERSWGDRLANKWNYRVPGLPELVEVHVQYLGQTGEHSEIAQRVITRRVNKAIGDRTFQIPAPEERIVISALQRVYRHFYFRLCDMVDMARLLETNTVDFGELKRTAMRAGVWPGIATFLCFIRNYLAPFDVEVELPEEVSTAAHAPRSHVYLENGFLRIPKSTAAGLYSSQLLAAGARRDVRSLLRLPLLPPLAVSALVAHGLTGNDKGIW
jgi:hypothetical protein